jgi:hypothetical protein
MLHPFDDYPVHQSSAPVMHVFSDAPGVYDRYFYNGHDTKGEIFFAVAFGVYPNKQVMDATFCVSMDGVQHSVRASRHCDRDRTNLEVGAIRIEVVRPMLEHRIIVDNRFGVSADITWRATSALLEEPSFKHLENGRPQMDYTRMTQFGEWSGWIEVDGKRTMLADVGGITGCRDRSWGVRNSSKAFVGPKKPPQFAWFWAPTTFDDMYTHAAVNEYATGRSWHRSGAVTSRVSHESTSTEWVLDETNVDRCTGVGFVPVWEPGTRWIKSATVTLDRWRAEPLVLTYTPVSRFFMRGIGYTHPEWSHGEWKGEFAEVRDEFVISEANPADPSMIHLQNVCRVECGGKVGVGVLEHLVIGPHEPSGFASILDGAR